MSLYLIVMTKDCYDRPITEIEIESGGCTVVDDREYALKIAQGYKDTTKCEHTVYELVEVKNAEH